MMASVDLEPVRPSTSGWNVAATERRSRNASNAMRVSVAFQDEQLELDLPGERLVGSCSGPNGVAGEDAAAAVRDVLQRPVDFPPFRQMFVPGDRVAIALDSTLG